MLFATQKKIKKAELMSNAYCLSIMGYRRVAEVSRVDDQEGRFLVKFDVSSNNYF